MGVFVRIVVRSGGGVGGVVRDEGEEGKKGEGVKKKCAGSGQFGVGWYGVDHPGFYLRVSVFFYGYKYGYTYILIV